MIASLGVNLWAIRIHLHMVQEAKGKEILDQYTNNIGLQLDFYKSVLRASVRQQEIKDLLVLGDYDAAQEWAQKQRAYLPFAVGFALVDGEERVLGEPVELRLGPACLADLKQRLAYQPLREPLVHRDNPRLAHFDLTQPVLDEIGQPLGLLIASFSLTSLQTPLERFLAPGQMVAIYDGNGALIAQAGTTPTADNLIRLEQPIPDSTWHIKLTYPQESNMAVYATLGGTNLITSLFIIAAFATLSFATIRTLVNEFTHIREILLRVKEGKPLDVSTSDLKEIADIKQVIGDIAKDIQNQQIKLTESSLTDELTGLPNRRHFNLELDRAFNLSYRGIPVCLLVIDMDGFKTINDNFGHASGDRMLHLFGKAIQQVTRKSDFAARLGGDEFAVLFTKMSQEYIKQWVHRLRETFAHLQDDDAMMAGIPRGAFGAGVTFPDPNDTRPEHWFNRADKAMYAAKRTGRNQLVLSCARAGSISNAD